MGEARRRGSYEERKAQEIAAGRVKGIKVRRNKYPFVSLISGNYK